MKKFRVLIVSCFVLIFSIQGFSRVDESVRNDVSKSPQLSTRLGSCVSGRAQINLDVNNVRAMLLNTGDMWWDREIARYEVPKRTQQQIDAGVLAKTALFAGSIWISGKVSGNLHLAAITFSSGGAVNFWPGPIKQGSKNIETEVCKKFDRFFEIKKVDDFTEGIEKGVYTRNVKEWPGKGNPYLIANGIFTAEELSEDLAPFYDADADGIYDYTKGDYPALDCDGHPVPDQMIFWVVNDVGNEHVSPSGTPIGLQVNCMAFAYATSDEFNNMTFYSYDIRNKSNSTLEESYMSQYVDCDLGNHNDDYVGCDTNRELGFCVNADAFDEQVTTTFYGDEVPIVATDFFEGPKDANGTQIGLTSFSYYLNGTEPRDPSLDFEFRNYQEGKTRNGQSFTQGADCLNPANPPTKFCFTGNPAEPSEWSMCSEGLPKRDVRYVQNSGPFEMESGTKETITVGVIFVQPPVGSYSGCQIDIEKHLIQADEKAQALFDNCFVREPGPDAPDLKIIEDDQVLFFSIENAQTSNNYDEAYSKKSTEIPAGVDDSTFKFEAYMIYQIPTPEPPSFTQLLTNSDNKLIKAMDIKNGISVMNHFSDNKTHVIDSIPLMDEGLEHTFLVTEDRLEQQGQQRLINSKTYYYATVAIAYNSFYDPVSQQSQLLEYKPSDVIKVFAATPHSNLIYGHEKSVEFGEKIPVTRIRGVGHGNFQLAIEPDDEKEIVLDGSSFIQEITYQGGKAPIDVTITDPYKIREARFTLTFEDTSDILLNKYNEDSTYWTLQIEDVEENATIILNSSSHIDRPLTKSIYAELNGKLLDYGISMKTGKISPYGVNNRNDNVTYEVINAEMVFEDSTNKWLKLVEDVNESEYEDWIRSGRYLGDYKFFSAGSGVVNRDFEFHDPDGKYASILDGAIAPYCLTANVNITDNDSAYASFAPGFRWRNIDDRRSFYRQRPEGPENNLDSLFSCEVVITDNREMWSQCVVFETGDNENTNLNGAKKGQLIQMESVDKFGEPNSGEMGRGWFPGYAINLETGERVNISFGENSSLRGDRAANMIWDPSSYVKLGETPIMGGSHFVYVMNTRYDRGEAMHAVMSDQNNYNVTIGNNLIPQIANLYKNLIWTFVPTAAEDDFEFMQDGVYKIPNEVRIKIHVAKPYGFFPNVSSSEFGQYFFETTKDMKPDLNDDKGRSQAAFDNMLIVPNPYNAYSVYEQNETQNIIKVVGVPGGSNIKIYTTDGTLVREVVIPEAQSPSYYGANQTAGETNLDNAYSWDMRTTSGVLISSGVYYFHVSHPDYGEKVLKLFATMRQLDVSKF